MNISPAALAEMLDVLRQKGVARFQSAELTIDLYPYQPEQAGYDLPMQSGSETVDLMDDPNLYPDGEVPGFTMKMKK